METQIHATPAMCAACFGILISTLKKENTDEVLERFYSEEPQVNYSSPLFVTWNIGSDLDLRGCIGTFDQTGKIGKTVPKYALISALNDSRFSPISLREVQHLTVSVSLLTNFTPIQNPLDWEIGKHGIEIEFRSGGRQYSGTYLPEVAHEQNWDQPTTLVSLFRKAGYKPNNANRPAIDIVNELAPNLKVTTYESSKLSMAYNEYLQYLSNRSS
jgi:AMME syndrome candidate gene 1 protein